MALISFTLMVGANVKINENVRFKPSSGSSYYIINNTVNMTSIKIEPSNLSLNLPDNGSVYDVISGSFLLTNCKNCVLNETDTLRNIEIQIDVNPPLIYISLHSKSTSSLKFNWSISDASTTNTTKIYLQKTATGEILVTVTSGLNYSYKFSSLDENTSYTFFVNETDFYGNSAVENLSASTTYPGFTYTMGTGGGFQGLIWQHLLMIVGVAISLVVVSFLKPDIPAIGALSGIFWLFSAISSNKVLIFLGDGQKITYMGMGPFLTYLFGLTGLLMLAYSIYNYISYAYGKVSEFDAEAERGRLTRTI